MAHSNDKASGTNQRLPSDSAINVHLQYVGRSKVKMLYYTLIFLLIAVVAGILGFWAVAGVAAVIAKTLFFIFLVVFIISLLSGLTRRV